MFPIQLWGLLILLKWWKCYFFFQRDLLSATGFVSLSIFPASNNFSPLYANTSTGVQVQSVPDMSCPGDMLSLLASRIFPSTVKINNCKDSWKWGPETSMDFSSVFVCAALQSLVRFPELCLRVYPHTDFWGYLTILLACTDRKKKKTWINRLRNLMNTELEGSANLMRMKIVWIICIGPHGRQI